MALIKCSECGKEISDKAKKCIHCGRLLGTYVKSDVETEARNVCLEKENSDLRKEIEKIKSAEPEIIDNTDYKAIEELNAEKAALQNRIMELENAVNKGVSNANISDNDNKRSDGTVLSSKGRNGGDFNKIQMIFNCAMILALILVILQISNVGRKIDNNLGLTKSEVIDQEKDNGNLESEVNVNQETGDEEEKEEEKDIEIDESSFGADDAGQTDELAEQGEIQAEQQKMVIPSDQQDGFHVGDTLYSFNGVTVTLNTVEYEEDSVRFTVGLDNQSDISEMRVWMDNVAVEGTMVDFELYTREVTPGNKFVWEFGIKKSRLDPSVEDGYHRLNCRFRIRDGFSTVDTYEGMDIYF